MRNYKNIAYEELHKDKRIKRIKNWLYVVLMLSVTAAAAYFLV